MERLIAAFLVGGAIMFVGGITYEWSRTAPRWHVVLALLLIGGVVNGPVTLRCQD